jgi:uncharacterized protein (DUF58 family)
MTADVEHATGATQRLGHTVSAKVTAYVALAVLLLGCALAARQPQLVALGAPFVVALLAGLVTTRRPTLTVATQVDEDRLIEEDELELVVTLVADVAIDRLELMLPLPPGLDFVDDVPMPHAVRLAAATPRELRYRLRATQWGVHRLGAVVTRWRDPLELTTSEGRFPAREVIRVYPRSEALRQLARPIETTLAVGSLVARQKGDGFEFSDIRPFLPGDRVRGVNWRATARRGALQVNERHPERSTDVVILIDAFDNATLPAAVRAAVSLARAYLRQRDRVAVVSFGGSLRWLRLGLGERQLYRIADALIESAAVYSYAWKALDVVPPQALPRGAMLVALSPLTDRRTVAALLDRAARGTEVAIVQVSLEPYAPPGPTATSRLGHVLWRREIERDADRIRARGVAVVPWREDEPLDAALEEVAAFQRFARHHVG